MSMTREEAVLAFLKDKKSVQGRCNDGMWMEPAWSDFEPVDDEQWHPDQWRPTPRPVPPGDLTPEAANDAIERGVKVQVWVGACSFWRDKTSPTCCAGYAYRLAPTPKLVPLGDLTFEEARDRARKGEPTQAMASNEANWRDLPVPLSLCECGSCRNQRYRATPTPVLVTLEMSDVLSTTEFRRVGMCNRIRPCEVSPSGVRFSYVGDIHNWRLLLTSFERTDDAGKSWRPCSKPEVAS